MSIPGIAPIEKSVIRKVSLRLVPFIGLMFFIPGAAAASSALINTTGNIAGFVAPYITGALKDVAGSYQVPMIVAGSMMLLSAVIAMTLTLPAVPAAAR